MAHSRMRSATCWGTRPPASAWAGPPAPRCRAETAWAEGLARIESIYRRVLIKNVERTNPHEPSSSRDHHGRCRRHRPRDHRQVAGRSARREWCVPVVLGDARVLEHAMARRRHSAADPPHRSVAEAAGGEPGTIDVIDDPHRHGDAPLGRHRSRATARPPCAGRRRPARWRSPGEIDAMVSAPLNKEAMHDAGLPLRGADGDPRRADAQQARDGDGRRPDAAHAVHEPHGAARRCATTCAPTACSSGSCSPTRRCATWASRSPTHRGRRA